LTEQRPIGAAAGRSRRFRKKSLPNSLPAGNRPAMPPRLRGWRQAVISFWQDGLENGGNRSGQSSLLEGNTAAATLSRHRERLLRRTTAVCKGCDAASGGAISSRSSAGIALCFFPIFVSPRPPPACGGRRRRSWRFT